MLINFTNHPSEKWPAAQLDTAIDLYGAVTDYPFPTVSPEATENDIAVVADEKTAGILEILQQYPEDHNAVLCQGEFNLCFAVVNRLLDLNIETISATTERITTEDFGNGTIKKTSEFRFSGFRKYSRQQGNQETD